MPNYEALQSLAKTRYKQDVEGALKRACEATAPGSTSNVSGINGLCVIAWNILSDPDRASGEWHDQALFNSATFMLEFSTAP